jgi:formate-dependent nitrite reductase membrane component NrfD
MDIAGIVTWIQTNWDNVIGLYLQIIGAASILVKITPTLKDDDVLKNIMRFMGKYIALNKSTENKQ